MSPRDRGGRRGGRRDQRGQSTVLIIGFAAVLLLLVAVVVDATAAYLKRQDLDTLADGAALAGADAGAQGRDVYAGGVGAEPLQLTVGVARSGVHAYLASVDAYRTNPGLRVSVSIRDDRVVVRLSAPVDLPLTVPGSPDRPRVNATGSAVTDPEATT